MEVRSLTEKKERKKEKHAREKERERWRGLENIIIVCSIDLLLIV